MPLPKIATPQYELTLPSTKQKVKYRPFLVKEEKVLVLAMETEDTKEITTAVGDPSSRVHDLGRRKIGSRRSVEVHR